MKLLTRLLAVIGMHALPAAAQAPAAAQPPFEYQLWAANHVVSAVALRSGERVSYRVQRVLKGNAGSLRFREPQVLDIDDGMWRLLGRRAETGDSVLLLLRGAQSAQPGHGVIEYYALGSGSRFTHAPDDASVRKMLTVGDVEHLLRAPPFDTRGCGRITLRGEYLLCIDILHGGTRSEGRSGRLYRHGVEVTGGRKGQIVDTEPTGGGLKFIFLGLERPHLWSVSGWDLLSNPR